MRLGKLLSTGEVVDEVAEAVTDNVSEPVRSEPVAEPEPVETTAR